MTMRTSLSILGILKLLKMLPITAQFFLKTLRVLSIQTRCVRIWKRRTRFFNSRKRRPL